jgi:hypothetical protein
VVCDRAQLFQEYNRDGSGALSFAEFCRAVRRDTQPPQRLQQVGLIRSP